MKISVITHPNNKRPRVEEDLTGQLHVYVSAPPLEGKANAAVINALTDHPLRPHVKIQDCGNRLKSIPPPWWKSLRETKFKILPCCFGNPMKSFQRNVLFTAFDPCYKRSFYLHLTC